MIKEFIKKFINISSEWKIMKPFAGLIFYMYHEWFIVKKTQQREQHMLQLLKGDIFKSSTVLHGPFKGMNYSILQSAGSSLMPKLLGTYERELHETIVEFCSRNYSDVIVVGCAEGFYAVGMALRLPNTNIHAFDTDPLARQLCQKLASINKVEDRVFIKETCTAEVLERFPVNGKTLIICDCEGFESELFTKENLHHLKNCDMIIEMHDFLNLKISGYLKNLIADTHDSYSIFSTDEIQKVHLYQLEELRNYSLEDRKVILSEDRPCIMEWLICTGKG